MRAPTRALRAPRAGARRQLFRDALALCKYRLSGLVALTSCAGYAARAERDERGRPACGGRAFARGLAAAGGGTFLCAGAASALNHAYERASDARMARTRLRPLAAGRVPVRGVVGVAVAAAAAGAAVLWAELGGVAAGLGLGNVVLYAGVYTPLKAVSVVNTWVGAVVGALPPLIGWAGASGGELRGRREAGAWALGGTLFLWQIPHFHALAVVLRKDYAAAGLRMLSVSDPARNAFWARATAAALVPAGGALALSDTTTDAFAVESAALGAWLWRGAGRMVADPTGVGAARGVFRASIVHLPLFMGLMLFHRTSPAERLAAYEAEARRREEMARRREERALQSGLVYYHPWETLAPFPFLPLPMLVPAAVVEPPAAKPRETRGLADAL